MKWLKRLFILSLVLTACGQPPQDLPPPTITVDPSLQPSTPSLPGFEDGEPRPVASVTGEDGVPAEFVANEVWLATDNEAELTAFLSRWQGKVLKSFNPVDAGVTGLSKQYLIRIVAAAADPSLLAEDLQKLDKTSSGDHKVSSQEALNLIAATSHEAVNGLKIGMNFVGNGAQQFRDRASIEAPIGTTLQADNPSKNVNYVSDAFAWSSHNRFSEQDIGVAEAWRALDLAGKLKNKVKIAVLDMGFQPDTDWPSGYQAISNVPFTDAIGTENLLFCGSGDCPWHGTNVVSAAMALPDNNYGSAGSAGPIADPVIVFTLYDFFTSVQALYDAGIAGAHIANMSYGAPVPWYLGWSVFPFEAATLALRKSGIMLLFASAGNEGKNVDAEGCTWGVCWERTWYTPCENAGVICVGGLDVNSKNKALDSNYGGEQVDIFAPFKLWLGPDPSAPDNKAQFIMGTSFSSPFVAGVAALIWAANPSLGAGEVEDILMETAHPNADDRVKRHVNALAAVQAALGNIPPSVTLPNSGDVPLNLELTLTADVTDFEDAFPCCAITWTSDVDGSLGGGRTITPTFTTLGSRTVTVTATDSASATSTATVTLNVINPAPEAKISKPLENDTALRTVPFLLRGRASDANEPNFELACNKLSWTSSVASDPFPVTGCEVEVTFASNGARILTLSATDSQGATDTATVNITVGDPPQNVPPTVRITSPSANSSVNVNETMTLSGTATDPEGATNLTYQWTAKLDDAAPVVIGNAPSVQWKPSDTYNFGGEGSYRLEIRLNVTDPQGNTGTDFLVFAFSIIL